MEEKKIIEFDFSSALDQLAALEKQAQETAKAMQGLDKATPEYQQLASELKVVRTEQNQLSQSVQASLKIDRQALDSLDAKKAQLKILRAEYSKLSGAQRENTEIGVKAAKNIKALQEEIRGLELGLGNTAANVGNYQEAIEKAFGNTLLGDRLKGIKDSLGQITSAFGAIGPAAKGAGGGIQGIGAATKVGFGAIIIIAELVIQLFKQMSENFEPFRVAIAQGTAVWKAWASSVIEFYYTVYEAIKAPTKAFELFSGWLDSSVDKIKQAASAGGDLENRLIAVEKAQRKVNVANAQLTAQVEEQEKIADNQAISFEDRVKAIKQAQEDEKKRGEAVIALEKEKLSIIEGRLKLEPRSKELLDQQAEAQVKIIELEGQQIVKLQDLANKQAEITRSSKDLALSILESNINAQVEAEKNFEKLLQKRLQLLEVQRQKELNAESLSLEQQIAINQNYANQKLALRRENNKQLVTEALEASITTLEAELLNTQKGSDEAYKIRLKLIEAERKAEIEAVNQEVISKQLRAAKLYKIEQDRLSKINHLNEEKAAEAKKKQDDADKIALEKKNEQTKKEQEILASLGRAKKLQLELDANSELLSIDERTKKKLELLELERQKELEIANLTAEERAAIDRKYAEERVKISDEAEVAKFQQIQSFTNQVTELFEQAKNFELQQAGDNAEKRAEIEKKYATRLRAIRSFEVITGTASAIIKTLADPTLLFPANVIAASLIGAQGAIQLATINAAKFNRGGLVPGIGDGDTVPAMLTPGEVVINKRAAQDNLPLLNAINTSTGGAAITQRFANGGVVLPTTNVGFDMQELVQALQNNPPIVRVTDISRAQTNQVRVAQTKTL